MIARTQRTQRIKRATDELFDLIVIGGGVQGVSAAREAVLRGYTVLLLEANDYAYGTSSRSSKLLHGGVRYLEQGNFGLVLEALREKSIVLQQAPHLARSIPFLFPIIPGKTRPRWQIQLGMALYKTLDTLFATRAQRPLSASSSSRDVEEQQWLRSLGLVCTGSVRYFDGQMDDARLVIEGMVDTNRLGGVTLNYARVTSVARDRASGSWRVGFTDGIGDPTEAERTARGRFLINTGGPWAPEIHRLVEDRWPDEWPIPQYSRGTHLLFKTPWRGPAIILPTGERGRYYFVLPFFSHNGERTLVGTTDRLSPNNEDAPAPSEQEREELLGYLQRDLPLAGLTRDSLYQSFAGMRILASPAGSPPGTKASEITRNEYLLEQESYLLSLGGKWTTARKIAEKTIDRVDRSFGRSTESLSRNRPYPGAFANTQEPLALCARLQRELSISEAAASRAVTRLGAQAARLTEQPFRVASENESDYALRAEIRYAIVEEHASTLRDVLWRRLGAAHQPQTCTALHTAIVSELAELLGTNPDAVQEDPSQP